MDLCNVTAVVRVIILKCLVRCGLVLSCLRYFCSEYGKGDGGGGSTNDGGCRGSPERYLASEDELFFSWIWLLKVPPEGLKIFRFAGNFVRRN